MATTAFAAISSFQMILFCKTSISIGSDVIVTFFQFDVLFKLGHDTKIVFYYFVFPKLKRNLIINFIFNFTNMFLIVSCYLFGNKFTGATIWPFIFLKEKRLKEDLVFMNHERIHFRQQIEMLVIPFYIWYLLEYLFKLIRYKKKRSAYLNISFEREAYRNEKDLEYLNHRSFWKFITYL